MLRSVIFFHILFLAGLRLFSQPAVGEPPMQAGDSAYLSEIARVSRLYRLDSSSLAACDKIITYGREVFVGKIHNITYSEVRFTVPFEDHLTSLKRSDISQILYADGRRDVFIPLEDRTVKQKELVDPARIIIKNQKDWMKVRVTEEPADVAGLVERGEIKASWEAETGNVSNDDLMRNVSVILKKKAAVLKAHIVLIESKFFQKAYGDLPKVEVRARVFGYE
jgi:hypothetical protein